jgi:hypothetical protein
MPGDRPFHRAPAEDSGRPLLADIDLTDEWAVPLRRCIRPR